MAEGEGKISWMGVVIKYKISKETRNGMPQVLN